MPSTLGQPSRAESLLASAICKLLGAHDRVAALARRRARWPPPRSRPRRRAGPACGPAGRSTIARHQVGDADEAGDEGGRRALVDGLGIGDLLDPAAVHDRDPVGHRQRLLLVVGDVDEGDPDLALDPLQLDLQPLAQLQVERAERLVEQQHLGQVDQRPGQRDALLHAARELVRAPVDLGREADPLELGSPPAA